MKRGVFFECGHGIDAVGTPYSECLDCLEKTRNCIAAWEAKKNVGERLRDNQCPF